MQNATRGKLRFQSVNLCATCLSCMTACSVRTAGCIAPQSSRIRIEFDPFTGNTIARFCRQCDKPKCVEACPQDAITKEPKTGIVAIDYQTCNACARCVDTCPFGALFWNPRSERIIKCDRCNGSPVCVDACKFEVLTYE